MSQKSEHDWIAEMRSFIERQTIAGFDRTDTIIERACEVFTDHGTQDVLQPIAQRFAHESRDKILQEQASWPEVTDCDRLDDAFAELTLLGIVSRQDFSCCGNCGVAEIGDEMNAE